MATQKKKHTVQRKLTGFPAATGTKPTSHFEEPVPGHQAFGDGVKDQVRRPKIDRIQLELEEERRFLYNYGINR